MIIFIKEELKKSMEWYEILGKGKEDTEENRNAKIEELKENLKLINFSIKKNQDYFTIVIHEQNTKLKESEVTHIVRILDDIFLLKQDIRCININSNDFCIEIKKIPPPQRSKGLTREQYVEAIRLVSGGRKAMLEAVKSKSLYINYARFMMMLARSKFTQR